MTTDLTTGTHDLVVYAQGICYASVCTRLSDEEATASLNIQWPTGISSSWQIADEPFRDGTPNSSPCDQNPTTHRHLLFSC